MSGFNKHDIQVSMSAGVLVLMLLVLVDWLMGSIAVLVGIAVLTSITLLAMINLYRRSSKTQDERLEIIQKEMLGLAHQVEALISINRIIEPVLPLPKTMGYAASPDFLLVEMEIILRDKPAIVLELGSGVSTLLAGYCMKKNGRGKVVALDHEQEYADKTSSMIQSHGLGDFATVIHAPLVDVTINERKWKYYDVVTADALSSVEEIDILVVDGPPRTIQKQARYPALPLLMEKLAKEFVILVDDGKRREDAASVKQWIDEYSGLDAQYIDLQKGAYLIKGRK